MTCPHCNKEDVNDDILRASRNAESYGESCFTFRCTNCKKKYSSYFEVRVVANTPFIVDSSKDLSLSE